MKRNTLLLIACLAFASFMGRLDTNIVSIALPTIAKTFAVLPSETSSLVMAYMLAQAVLLIPFGNLGDRVGFRVLLLAGYAVFTLGSLLCGLAPSLLILTAARAIQGVGAALLLIAAYSIIPQKLPPNRVGAAMGALALASSLGILCGAPLGGMLTEHFDWESIFIINIPFGLIALVLCVIAIKPDEPGREKRVLPPFDWNGCIRGFSWVLALTLGLDRLRADGFTVVSFGLIAAGIALFYGFLVHQKRCEHPLVDLSVFSDRSFSSGLRSRTLVFMALAGQGFTMPFFLYGGMGLSTQAAGLTIALFPVGTSLAGPLAGRLADKIDARPIIVGALIVCSLTSALFALAIHLNIPEAVNFYLPCIGLGFGAFLTPNAKLLLTGLPRDRQGNATSIFHTTSNLAILIGVAIGSLLLRMGIHGQTGPETIPLYLPVYVFVAGCYFLAAFGEIALFFKTKNQPVA